MPRSTPEQQSLRSVLVSKFDGDRHRLRHQIDAARRRYGSMSQPEALAVVAEELKLPLHRYLSQVEIDRVRTIIGGAGRPTATPSSTRTGPKVTARARAELIVSGEPLITGDPILPSGIAADAGRMASVYPLTYVFENSIRELVARVMVKAYGEGWCRVPNVPGGVLKHIDANKKNEGTVPWHGARGSDDVHYTSIDDLIAIMNANNNWALFQPILGDQNAAQFLMRVIEQSRHTIAHHRPLSAADVQSLKVNLRNWQTLLRRGQHLI